MAVSASVNANSSVLGLPEFPDMAPLQVGHLPAIGQFTQGFEGYSDFNTTSLWAWSGSVAEGYRVAAHRGNLVVEFGDYVGGGRFLSFLGASDVTRTALELLAHAREAGIDPMLRLVPEVVVEMLDEDLLVVTEDRDAFDYLYSVRDLVHLDGARFRKHRAARNKFAREWAHETEFRWLCQSDFEWAAPLIEEIAAAWHAAGDGDAAVAARETLAIRHLLATAAACPSIADWSALVVIRGVPVAFAINGHEGPDEVVGHFCKAVDHPSSKVLYTCISLELARRAESVGVSTLNLEQDLGLPGLRVAKTELGPASLLQKFNVALR
jgi:hypothetical protein